MHTLTHSHTYTHIHTHTHTQSPILTHQRTSQAKAHHCNWGPRPCPREGEDCERKVGTRGDREVTKWIIWDINCELIQIIIGVRLFNKSIIVWVTLVISSTSSVFHHFFLHLIFIYLRFSMHIYFLLQREKRADLHTLFSFSGLYQLVQRDYISL